MDEAERDDTLSTLKDDESKRTTRAQSAQSKRLRDALDYFKPRWTGVLGLDGDASCDASSVHCDARHTRNPRERSR